MKDVHEQASFLLQRQCETDDPLDAVRREAVSHVLTQVLDSDGFTILITSSKGDKTNGLALAGGTIPKKETLAELLRAVGSVAGEFGVELELKTEPCLCPECRTKKKKQTLH